MYNIKLIFFRLLYHCKMEIELNGVKLRVYEDGKIERFFKTTKWQEMKGNIANNGYCQININNKMIRKHRIIAMAFLGLDITDITILKNKELYIDYIMLFINKN